MKKLIILLMIFGSVYSQCLGDNGLFSPCYFMGACDDGNVPTNQLKCLHPALTQPDPGSFIDLHHTFIFHLGYIGFESLNFSVSC